MEKMGVSFVAVDFTNKEKAINEWKDLPRTDSAAIPVNLIYPPNYPEEPAIKMDIVFGPAEINKVLDRMEEIVSGLDK